MFEIEETSNNLVPLQKTPYSKRHQVPAYESINESFQINFSMIKMLEDGDGESHRSCRPCYKTNIRDSCLREHDSSRHHRTGFLDSKQDDTTAVKTSPNEDCFQTKTDDKITKSLNMNDGTYRRPCPRCNLETIVGRKQLKTMASGLHVICCRCKLDWCFTCESKWHPGDACSMLSNNSSAHDGKTEHPGPKILGDSIDSDSDDSYEASTVYVTFNYEELKKIRNSHYKESSTKISNKDTWSISAKYTNKVKDVPSVIFNIENTCDICFANSTDDIRECCQIRVCGDCIRTYLTLKIRSGLTYIPVTCPNHGCNQIITEAEISRSVDEGTFLKYQQNIVNEKRDPYRKTCPRCSYITVIDALNGSKDGLRINCPECELCWCFNCQAPWHRNKTCSDYRSGDDEIFKKWALDYSSGQINAQKCPECQVYSQRNGGCNRMKCTQCGTDFCYECGERGFNHGDCETRNNFNVGADNLFQARNDFNVERNYQPRRERRRNRLDLDSFRYYRNVSIVFVVFTIIAFLTICGYFFAITIRGRNNSTSYSDSTSSLPYLNSNFPAL